MGLLDRLKKANDEARSNADRYWKEKMENEEKLRKQEIELDIELDRERRRNNNNK